MDFLRHKKNICFWAMLLLLFLPCFPAEAISSRETINFYVDESFDSAARTQVLATLVKTSPKLYFYFEKAWWDQQVQAKKDEILLSLDGLSNEFDAKIYPALTSVFGSERNPGVDNDARITILFEQMSASEGGYFRTADEYVKLQISDSNEREMIYLSLDIATDSKLKTVLAHEFVHLITFNQKNIIYDADEDIWLNEARADYSSAILGYDDNYESSNLKRRVKDFAENTSDSIVEWQGTKYDYASVALFVHYLVDHYSVSVLIDSLKSQYVGIDSINRVLQRMDYQNDFSKVFTDWTIASLVNNCALSDKYCYLNSNLKNFKIVPSLNFLPLTGNISLSVSNVTKNWSGSWLKFIGGKGNLELSFSSLPGLNFVVPYLTEDSAGSYKLNYLLLDENEKGRINVENFGSDYKSLVIMPSLQSKFSGFDGLEPTYPFTYAVQIKDANADPNQSLIQQLLDQIAYLKAEIARILLSQDNKGSVSVGCSQITQNLSAGMQNSGQVRCLQQFLKSQADIYPEGYVTGNFASLTMAAVIRFQEKYSSEILAPFGLSQGTGYVGEKTRQKINQLINK